MVKQHLDELDHRIQEMMAFRQALVSQYDQIEAFVPDSVALPKDTLFNGRICGLIEWSNGDET